METKSQKLYSENKYDCTHWAVRRWSVEDPEFIAFVSFNGVRFLVKANPTDMRGYRYIVVLYNETDMLSTLNRNYSLKERIALLTVLGIVSQIFEDRGLIAQINVAGNNSQSATNDTLKLGNEKEPSMLHGHGFGRGILGHSYFPDAPLTGPEVGSEFLLRADKKPWTSKALISVVESMRSDLFNLLKGLKTKTLQVALK